MRNKILNCQNFAFHNVTLWFSHHAWFTFVSSPCELTKYRCLSLFGLFFLKTVCVCENNRKVEFLKISSTQAEDSAKCKD